MNQPTTNHLTKHHRNYIVWTWIIAILAALILLWMLMTGRGPLSTCCGTSSDTNPIPTNTSNSSGNSDGFSFNANSSGLTTTGDGRNITWLSQAATLNTILNGEDLQAKGNDKNVVLSGNVENEAVRQKISADAQEFFGPSIVIDNQIAILASDNTADYDSVPATIKVYFESGKSTLPTDAIINLAAIIDWLKTYPESKAILSGYHDPKGDKALNEKLAKARAKSVQDALIAAGIDDNRIEMLKPQTVDGGEDLAEARRVEVSIE